MYINREVNITEHKYYFITNDIISSNKNPENYLTLSSAGSY